MAVEAFPSNYKGKISQWCRIKTKKIMGKKRREHKFDSGKMQITLHELVDKINLIIYNLMTEDDIVDLIEENMPAPGGGDDEDISDRRLKTDVNFVGKSASGLNIYTFRFKDSTKYGKGLYQGVMSDEVPESVVVKGSDGYDMVNYGMIDVDFVSINKRSV